MVRHELDQATNALSRSVYSDFRLAGFDTFGVGPAQDQNAFLELQNILPAVNGGLNRRWGVNTLYANPSPMAVVRTFPFNATQDGSDPGNTEAVDLIISTDNQNFQTLKVTSSGTAPTPLTNTLVATPWTGSGPSSFAQVGDVYGLASRRYFYYSNGVAIPRKVSPGYITTNTDSNWGIVAPAAYYQSGDPDSTPLSTITAIGGTGKGYTSVPTVTISGGGGTGATATALIASGMVTGFVISNAGTGYTSTPSVEISGGGGAGASAVAVYTDQGAISAVLPTGPIVLNSGRTYTYAYKNSISGHCSDIAQGIQNSSNFQAYLGNAATVLSPVQHAVGNVPQGVVGFSQIIITITPTGTIDPQVDTLVLLATSDGGSLEKLYEVKQIAINAAAPGTITVTDTLPDTYNSSAVGSSSNTLISISGVHAKVYGAPASNGVFDATSGSTVLFEQDFNSLMFNTHPVVLTDGYAGILPGYTVTNANQSVPFKNQSITSLGTWSSDVVVQKSDGSIKAGQSPHFNFQMILTGQFYVSAPGNITFHVYADAAHVVCIDNSATHVSGLQNFGGVTTSPLNAYPAIFGQNDNTEDWHNTAVDPKVVNFPAAGTYNFEICYATANHDEREFAMTANSSVLVPGAAAGAAYTGLTLLNSNLWVDTDTYGQLFGIINNTPPPSTLKYPVAHQGRIFATDGQNVFFSKSIADVTTSTGLITSKWEEAWPATNVLPIAFNNEVVTGLKSDGSTLHIGTSQSIYSLQGTDPTNFTVPSMLFQETGVLSHDLWNVVFAEGRPAGYMWITPDLKWMYSDFNTYDEIGKPVYSLLSQWASSFTPTASMNSFTWGPYNFTLLCFKRNGQSSAEYLLFETSLKRFYHWTVTASTSGPLSSFVYEHPETGYRAFFFAETDASHTNYRLFDPARTTDSGQAIPWRINTTWQNMGDPENLKVINELEVITDEPSMNVSIFGARNQSQFDNTVLLASGPLTTSPLQTLKFYCAGKPTAARYYAFVFTSTITGAVPSAVVNILNGFRVQHYAQARF